MRFPLDLYDISLWLAVTAIVLITTAEFFSTRYGQTGLIIEKGRLRTIALIFSALFLSTVAIRIYQLILTI